MAQKPTSQAVTDAAKRTREIEAAQEAGKAARTPTGPAKPAAIQRDTTSLADLAARSKPLASRPIQSSKPLGLPRGGRGRSFSRD